MKDHVFLSEFRKRVSVLESTYEALERDLKAARVVLAMLERESVNNAQGAGNLTQAELIAEIAIDTLSQNGEMHRGDILDAVVSRGVHVGYDDDKKKQLSGLSTLLSKDARFNPVKGKSGYWSLARTDLEYPDTSVDSSDVCLETGIIKVGLCSAEDGVQENTIVTKSGVTQARDTTASRHSGVVAGGILGNPVGWE